MQLMNYIIKHNFYFYSAHLVAMEYFQQILKPSWMSSYIRLRICQSTLARNIVLSFATLA